ncbi:SMP-30/gluconolactonase/LRE family protein [Pseudonocardia sp.]|uniref:SMP-30/gluconolactonase/LRE family protein n=1 Tax=Pseudonocardia sp. TaxID=60912 RepID=UPI003D0D926D
MDDPRVLLDGLAYVESPRWHDGRLWFAHWGAGEIIAVDLDGRSEVVAEGPPGLGWSVDHLPDGRLLVSGERLVVHEPDGTVRPYGDLHTVADHGWNEIAVAADGSVYVNGFGFDFLGGAAPEPGVIALVTPDERARIVARDVHFPNGMVLTPDGRTMVVAESFAGCLTAFDIEADGGLAHRRVWADGLAPDGISLDAEGAIWTGAAGGFDPDGVPVDNAAIRVREGGTVLDRVPVEDSCFATALGGPDGRALFLLTAVWRGIEQVDAVLAERTGRVLVAEAPVPAA